MKTAPPSHQNPINWQEHVKAWRESGLPMSHYCNQHDLVTHQLGYYKRKFALDDCQQNRPAGGFAQVTVSNSPSTQNLSLHLSHGLIIEGISPQNVGLAAALVRALS